MFGSSFLSFSFRFVILQILRFIITMRDWLALPLNPNTNNSDEAITIDNEDGRTYDMMNKSAQKEQKSSELQGLSSWFSILNMFGVANQNNKKASGSSSRSIGHCSSTDNNVLEQDHSEESISAVQKSQEKESHHKEENKSYSHEEDFSNHEEDSISYHLSSDEEELSSQEQEPSAQKEETDVNEQDQVAYLNQEQVSHIEKSTVANQDEEDHLLVRSDSMSSIASSVETDNSTTATSEIKRSSYHKYNTMTHVKVYYKYSMCSSI